jgi:hypothetical protein
VSWIALRVIFGIVWRMTTEAVEGEITPWMPSDEVFGVRLAMIRHRMGWNAASSWSR